MNKLQTWWISLTPDRRKAVVGVGTLTVLLGLLYSFLHAGPDRQARHVPEARADVNLLTGSDTRTLGLEAVGAELRDSHRRQRELQDALIRLQQQSSTKEELSQLAEQISSINRSLLAAKEPTDQRITPAFADVVRKQPDVSNRVTGAAASDRANTSAQLAEEQPRPLDDPARGTRGASTGARSEPVEPIKVRVFGGSPPTSKVVEVPQVKDAVYLPAGSIIRGVLLTGVDVPTGLQARRDPTPALMLVKHDAILPNRFRADIRECVVLWGATGELSTERALMRAERLACIRYDGGVIEAQLDAWALGDDGKAGIRGRLVARNGALIAKAAFASFAQALSQIFRPVALAGLNTTPSSRTEFQAPDTAEAAEAATYAGFGGAMRSLSDYFVKMADEIIPFVEVDAARQIEGVLLKGVTLELKGQA